MAFTRAGSPSHDTLSGVSIDDHHARDHALNSATLHTGEISDTQHGARTEANAHLHSALSTLGSPHTDHSAVAAVDYARSRLWSH